MHNETLLSYPSLLQVTAGYNNNNDPGSKQTRPAKHIYKHENYDHGTLEHDIAIVVLNGRFEYNDKVSSINVPQAMQNFGGCMTVAGWGAVSVRSRSEVSSPTRRNDQGLSALKCQFP